MFGFIPFNLCTLFSLSLYLCFILCLLLFIYMISLILFYLLEELLSIYTNFYLFSYLECL